MMFILLVHKHLPCFYLDLPVSFTDILSENNFDFYNNNVKRNILTFAHEMIFLGRRSNF